MALALVPMTFLGVRTAGLQMSGIAWMVLAIVLAALLLVEPVPAAATRAAALYFVFLAYATASLAWSPQAPKGMQTLVQLTVPALAYLTVANVSDVETVARRASRVAQVGIGVAATATIATMLSPGPLPVLVRPMSIGVIGLFLTATCVPLPRRAALLLAALSLLVTFGTGSRGASLVLLVIIALTPAVAASWRQRLMLGLALVAAVMLYTQTAAFKTRFFFDPSASTSLGSALESGQLNTAGRREAWPKIVDVCSSNAVSGSGLGAADVIAHEVSQDALTHPHNDYLRAYCDVGYMGGALFFGFFVVAAVAAGRRAGVDRHNRNVHITAVLFVVALLLISIADNPLLYTAHFMVPLMVVLGLSRLMTEQPSLKKLEGDAWRLR